MSESDFIQAVAFILKDVDDDEQRAEYEASILDCLERSDGSSGLEALDRNLLGGGGAAFQWEDFLDLADVWDSLELIRDSLSPSKCARLLVTLLLAWRRLRAVRIPLSKSQFLVMRAVKRGHANFADIVRYTGLGEETVRQAISELAPMRYQRDIPLIEVGPQGIVTQF